MYGNDDADESYNQALALIDAHPDLKLIMAPTTVGIAAAAKAMQDEGLCETVKVSGLGLPDEMQSYTENGCAPEFALWSFVDLGYVTFYAAHGLATGRLQGRGGSDVHRRPHGRVHDREGPDPRRRACGSSWVRSPCTTSPTSAAEHASDGRRDPPDAWPRPTAGPR